MDRAVPRSIPNRVRGTATSTGAAGSEAVTSEAAFVVSCLASGITLEVSTDGEVSGTGGVAAGCGGAVAATDPVRGVVVEALVSTNCGDGADDDRSVAEVPDAGGTVVGGTVLRSGTASVGIGAAK